MGGFRGMQPRLLRQEGEDAVGGNNDIGPQLVAPATTPATRPSSLTTSVTRVLVRSMVPLSSTRSASQRSNLARRTL